MIDQLIKEIQKKACPICAGLDTRFEHVPEDMRVSRGAKPLLQWAADCIVHYNIELLDALADVVPSIKIQSACYEMYGPSGEEAMLETIREAKKRNLLVIADIKRNDIGSTAEAYASAYLGRVSIGDELIPVYDADFATVNPYLGSDGIKPFLDDCAAYNKGIFILAKTSNPSSGELQDLELKEGTRVYEKMMDAIDVWGSGLVGENGFSEVGAVVGATYPEQAVALRQLHPSIFFLLPGVGAQGGDIAKLTGCFDKSGRGAVINVSRTMLTAWKNPTYNGRKAPDAAREVLVDLQRAILKCFSQAGIHYDREGIDFG